MKPKLQKGQLTTWKDDKGFGFIKPEGGEKTVFLHISALKEASRRPKVGDIILYEQVSEANGKIRAARASIQGVADQPPSTKSSFIKNKNRKNRFRERMTVVAFLAVASLLATLFNSKTSPPPVTPITQSECVIKGNVSVATGKKVYHLPGMEDYQSTTIDPNDGERWFCTETEAVANGWSRAPR